MVAFVALFFDCHTYQVGEVILALRIKLDLLKVRPEPLRIEDVDAAINLGDGALREGGVSVLHHGEEALVMVPYNAAVARRVISNAGEHGKVSVCLLMLVEEGA